MVKYSTNHKNNAFKGHKATAEVRGDQSRPKGLVLYGGVGFVVPDDDDDDSGGDDDWTLEDTGREA